MLKTMTKLDALASGIRGARGAALRVLDNMDSMGHLHRHGGNGVALPPPCPWSHIT